MVSLKALAKRGITDDSLKEKFTAIPYPFTSQQHTAPDDITRCAYRVRTRVQDGILNNFRNYKIFYAIDQAWDAPFKQVTPTLVQALAADKFDEGVMHAAEEWGYTHLITEEKDEKTGKPTGKKKMSLPTFFKVIVPLVRAYVLIRAAKLTGDRNLVPFFKFDPTKNTAINRARCEIITDRIEAMSTQTGLRDIARQCILKMLMYSVQLQFIQEEWWKDEQEDDDGNLILIREGLRYHLPHPTRSFADNNHDLATFNSDIGCEFAGYWRVRRFRDVRQNAKLWNTDRIAFNAVDLRRDQAVFFNTVYSACTLQFPQACSKWAELDRETNMSHRFYTSDFDDSAVILTEYFERLIPSLEGIGDYDYPVWFRFVTGGDGTILYAAPLPACPIVHWGYDPDGSRYLNASLALEVLPFQDQVSNLTTQALLSVRQNLANVTFVDSDMVQEDDLRSIENRGEGMYRGLNFIRFSGRKFRQQQQDVRYAFGSVRFPQLDVPSILNAINAVLGILERVLVMSAQEIAGQATHEQSREEILNVQQSTSTRLNYTSMQVDRAIDGWKRQLYTYLMAFGADEVYGEISQDPAYTPEVLQALGFNIVHTSADPDHGHLVKGPKKQLQLEYFSATRDGNDRINNTTIAQAMIQILSGALANPMLAQAIGPQQAIQLMNQVLTEMGLPRDFKLRALPAQMPQEQQQQQVQQQLAQLSDQVKQFVQQGQQQVLQQVGSELKPLADAIKQSLSLGQDNKMAISKIVQLVTQMEQHGPMNNRLLQPPNDNGRSQPALTIGGPAAPAMAQPA